MKNIECKKNLKKGEEEEEEEEEKKEKENRTRWNHLARSGRIKYLSKRLFRVLFIRLAEF